MSQENIPIGVQRCYPGAWIRGPRITRLEETALGYFRLDAETAWNLGNNNVGVFIGGCPSLGRTIERLQQLEQSTITPYWIIVAATKKMAAVFVQQWFRAGQGDRVAITTLKLPKVHQNIILATPESLRRLGAAERCNIAGIVVVDMLCHIHKARGGIQNGTFFASNDRPQQIANFRNSVAIDGWLPPLLFVTEKPAKSVTTDAVARAYCLDAWWFVDGNSLRCGSPPASEVAVVNCKRQFDEVPEVAFETRDQVKVDFRNPDQT